MSKKLKLEAELSSNQSALQAEWSRAFTWLSEFGFIASGTDKDAATLTPRGKACAAFADGQPLIIGTIIADGWLGGLTPTEVCAWLCLFLQERRLANEGATEEMPKPSAALEEVIGETLALAEMLDVPMSRTLSLMMLDWLEHKETAGLTRIAQWLDPHMLGVFVKAVLRVVSYVDVVREVLLGLTAYDTYNKLDNHTDLLLGGLVTNESLYLRLAE